MDSYHDWVGGSSSSPRHIFGNPYAVQTNSHSVVHQAVLYDSIPSDEITAESASSMGDDDMFLNYGILSAVQRKGDPNYPQTVAIGRALCDIFDRMKYKKVWADSDATFRITHGYLSGKYCGDIPSSDKSRYQYIDAVARDICAVAVAANRSGSNVLNKFIHSTTGLSSLSKEGNRMLAWSRGTEQMRMHTYSATVKEAHEALRAGCIGINVTDLERSDAKFCGLLGAERVFRIVGLTIIEYTDAVYILDYAGIDQLHSISKFWEGASLYCHNYRLSGKWDRLDMVTPLKQAMEWIVLALESSNFSDSLPRSMKQSVALLQNNFHAESEVLNVHDADKAESLTAAIADILPLPTYWHDKVLKLDVPDRAKMDLANLYYGLPSPDCDLRMLFARASEYMEKARSVDWAMFEEFMNYVKALDFCKAVCRFRGEVKYRAVDGYNVEDQAFYKSCMKGNLALPPDEDMGKVWLYKHFEYVDTFSSWYYDVGDVTRVDADIDYYANLDKYSSRSKASSNELLYALENAPMLSGGRTPESIYESLAKGTDNWSRIAEMAAKNENTKPGSKVRETWSADDITRELTSAYDKCGIPLSQLYVGATARKGLDMVEKIFDRIKMLTRPDRKDLVYIISNDVSGWSPLADRTAWAIHHDYVVETTKAPESFKLRHIWKSIHAVLAKRGFLATHKMDKGLFQGWTGCIDTLLNVRLSLFCVRRARRLGLLLRSEGANTAGLIDDAVQAVEFDKNAGVEHAQHAADSHFRITAETWVGVAAELDEVKTLTSSCKFIFLNRFFCQGSEVFTPLKIFAKADREHNRRFATIHAQIDTVYGSYRASVEKGACPIAAYYCATVRVLELIFMTAKDLVGKDMLEIINAAFAPRGFGGWGLPSIGRFLTQECKDNLVAYITIMATFKDVSDNQHPDVLRKIDNLVMSTLAQEKKIGSAFNILAAPWDVMCKSTPNPTATILRRIKEGMLNKAKSEIFRDALIRKNDDAFYRSLGKVLGGLKIDISVAALFYKCSPDSCAAELVDRAYKNELVTQLFPFKVRDNLSRIVRKEGGAAIRHLFNLDVRNHGRAISRSSALTLAYEVREEYLVMNGLHLLNHTTPDYTMSLARQPSEANASITVSFSKIIASCPQEQFNGKNPYLDLYDGILKEPGRRVPRSQSAYDYSCVSMKAMNPIARALDTMAMLVAHLNSIGGPGQLLWSMGCMLWGSKTVIPAPVVTVSIKSGTNFKRLNPHNAHVAHEIACYKNTQLMVQVDCSNLARWMDANNTNIDMMSYITAARCLGCLEASCFPSLEDCQGMKLHYAFLEDTLVLTEPGGLIVTDSELVAEGMSEASGLVNEDLRSSIIANMVNVTFEDTDLDEIITIDYGSGSTASHSAGTSARVMPGYISEVIKSGVSAPLWKEKGTKVTSVRADEIFEHRHSRAATRFRKYQAHGTASQAAIVVAIETVRDLVPGGMNIRVASARWVDVPDEFAAFHGSWRQVFTNVSSCILSLVPSLSRESVIALMGHLPHHIVTELMHLKMVSDQGMLLFVSYLYLAAYGRLRTPDSYTLTSAMGPDHISRCWRTAADIRRYRRSRSSKDVADLVIIDMYSSVARAAKGFSSREQVMQAMFAGACIQMANRGVEHSAMPDRALINGWVKTGGVSSLRGAFLQIIRLTPGIINLRILTDTVDNLINDIFAIGEIKAIIEESPIRPLAVHYMVPVDVRLAIEVSPITIGEEQTDSSETPMDVDMAEDHRKDAVAAYLTCGIDVAIQVLRGELNMPRTFEPTQEEVDEFEEELGLVDIHLDDMQVPDEI